MVCLCAGPAGVLSLRSSEHSLVEVARLLEVQPEALADEVMQVGRCRVECYDTGQAQHCAYNMVDSIPYEPLGDS